MIQNRDRRPPPNKVVRTLPDGGSVVRRYETLTRVEDWRLVLRWRDVELDAEGRYVREVARGGAL